LHSTCIVGDMEINDPRTPRDLDRLEAGTQAYRELADILVARGEICPGFECPGCPACTVVRYRDGALHPSNEAPRGNGTGTGASKTARPATERQLALIASLAAERIHDLDVNRPLTARDASSVIDALFSAPRKDGGNTSTQAPTERQLAYLDKLLAEKDHGWGEDEVAAVRADKAKASKAIDALQGMPRKSAEARKAAAASSGQVTEDGMYRTPDDEIYKVQRAVNGSGNLYAKLLVKLDEPIIKRGKLTWYEFEYASGAIRKLRPEWKMSLEEAKEWGALYGSCCVCGATLTDDSAGGSIEQGIGPVCASKF
jgi:hypothetical protein